MATDNNFDTGSDQITQLCIFCDSNVSDGFCGDCEDHMCQPCFDMHTKVKGCRHHVLLNDVSQKDNKKTYTETCKRHLNQSIKFYCVAHKIVGCVECFFPEHRNCNYQNIDDAAKSFQDNCEDIRLKREIHRLENTHSEYTRQHEEDKETVAVINNTVVNDVKSFTDSVTAYVAQVEKHVLEKSESLHVENKTRLERRFNDLDSVGTEIEKCKVQLEDEDRVNRLFISAIEIGPVIEKLRKKIASIGRQHVVTKYEFQPNKLIMEMVYGSGSFGDVYILPDGVNKNYTDESTHSAPNGITPSTITTPPVATQSTDTVLTGTTHSTVSTPAGTTQPTVCTPTWTTQPTVCTPTWTTLPTASTPAGTTLPTVSTPAGTTQPTASIPAGTTQPTVSRYAGKTQSTDTRYAGATQSTDTRYAGKTEPTVSTPSGTTHFIVFTPAGTTQSTDTRYAEATQSIVSRYAGTTQSTVSTPAGKNRPLFLDMQEKHSQLFLHLQEQHSPLFPHLQEQHSLLFLHLQEQHSSLFLHLQEQHSPLFLHLLGQNVPLFR